MSQAEKEKTEILGLCEKVMKDFDNADIFWLAFNHSITAEGERKIINIKLEDEKLYSSLIGGVFFDNKIILEARYQKNGEYHLMGDIKEDLNKLYKEEDFTRCENDFNKENIHHLSITLEPNKLKKIVDITKKYYEVEKIKNESQSLQGSGLILRSQEV